MNAATRGKERLRSLKSVFGAYARWPNTSAHITGASSDDADEWTRRRLANQSEEVNEEIRCAVAKCCQVKGCKNVPTLFMDRDVVHIVLN